MGASRPTFVVLLIQVLLQKEFLFAFAEALHLRSCATFSLKGEHSLKLTCPEAFRSAEDHTREHGRRLGSRGVGFFEIQDGTLPKFAATSCPNSCQQRLEAPASLRDLLVVSTTEWIWSVQ
jgi:hypothetical protein